MAGLPHISSLSSYWLLRTKSLSAFSSSFPLPLSFGALKKFWHRMHRWALRTAVSHQLTVKPAASRLASPCPDKEPGTGGTLCLNAPVEHQSLFGSFAMKGFWLQVVRRDSFAFLDSFEEEVGWGGGEGCPFIRRESLATASTNDKWEAVTFVFLMKNATLLFVVIN